MFPPSSGGLDGGLHAGTWIATKKESRAERRGERIAIDVVEFRVIIHEVLQYA
jgi:hypothetical protein